MVLKKTVLVLCLIINVAVLAGCEKAPRDPVEAFNLWVKLQENHQYEKAWSMMGKELQDRRGIRGFHVGIVIAGWRGEYERFVEDEALYDFGDESGDAEDLISRVDRWEMQKKGDKALLTKVVPYRGFDWHMEAVLVNRSGQWQITEFSAIGHLPPGSKMKWIE